MNEPTRSATAAAVALGAVALTHLLGARRLRAARARILADPDAGPLALWKSPFFDRTWIRDEGSFAAFWIAALATWPALALLAVIKLSSGRLGPLGYEAVAVGLVGHLAGWAWLARRSG